MSITLTKTTITTLVVLSCKLDYFKEKTKLYTMIGLSEYIVTYNTITGLNLKGL